MLRITAIAAVLLLGTSCRDSQPTLPAPELPSPRHPASHAPEADPPPVGVRERPRLSPSTPPPIRVPAPIPAAEQLPPALPEGPVIPDQPEEIPPPPEVPPSPELAAEQWLLEASALVPGCLLRGQPPQLPLPSPRALAHILRTQPRDFGGVAREALVCLFRLPDVTGAEVYGNSAFQADAEATEALLAGGERPIGVLVAAIRTDEPRGAGAIVVALDERAGGWFIRGVIYLPWTGDVASHELDSTATVHLLDPRREGLVVRQRDRYTTREHHVALTTTERLIEAVALPVRAAPPDGTKLVAKLHRRGRGFPRKVVYRVLESPPDGPRRWAREVWTAGRDSPYTREERQEGVVAIAGVYSLLDAGASYDARWLAGELPKDERDGAAYHRLMAEIEAGRGRHRTADRHWRRALAADDALPQLHRDYGLYLAGHKRRRKAAIAALLKYLERVPDAPDRAAIEAHLAELGHR